MNEFYYFFFPSIKKRYSLYTVPCLWYSVIGLPCFNCVCWRLGTAFGSVRVGSPPLRVRSKSRERPPPCRGQSQTSPSPVAGGPRRWPVSAVWNPRQHVERPNPVVTVLRLGGWGLSCGDPCVGGRRRESRRKWEEPGCNSVSSCRLSGFVSFGGSCCNYSR